MLQAAHTILLSGFRVLLVLAVLGVTASSALGKDVKCDGTEDQCVKGKKPDPNHQPYEFCMALNGDHEHCAQITGYSGDGSSEGGGINHGSPTMDPIEQQRQVCQAQVDEIMARQRDVGVTPRFPTRHYAGCMKGAISQQFFKEMWCEVAPDWTKEVIASGGCAAYYVGKKGSRRVKAIKTAACTTVMLMVGEC